MRPEQLRARLTFSNVISVLALFIALGGGAMAAVKLKANQVKTKNIAHDAVTGDKALESSFGQVPSAAAAQAATTAQNASNAAALGGSPPSAFFPDGNVTRLDFEPSGCAASTPACTNAVLTVAGFELDAICEDLNAVGQIRLSLAAIPAGGSADFDLITTGNMPFQGGTATTGTVTGVSNATTATGVGTMVLRSPTDTITLDFHLLSTNAATTNCEVHGIALRG